jgi:shikimate dehydrogenase
MAWQTLEPAEKGARIAVIGSGLGDSLLPAILEAGARSTDLPSQVLALEVSPDQFEPCVQHLEQIGFRGASIAHPHKVHAARLAQRFFTVKHAMGVANALIFENGVWGQNNEVAAIQALIAHLEPTTALLMGAGSGARSVAVALLDAGWKVRIWNRNGMRARMLQNTVKAFGELEIAAYANPTGCNLVVNATALGRRAGERPPMDWTYVRRGTTVMDIVYRRVPTELLREASVRGLKVIDGRQIVVEKAALSLEWWLERQVERPPMLIAAGLKS